MDAIVGFAAILAGLVAALAVFGIAALRLGTDSRDPIGDDWKRRNPSWHH